MTDDKSTLVFDIDAAEAFVVLFAAVAAADNQY